MKLPICMKVILGGGYFNTDGNIFVFSNDIDYTYAVRLKIWMRDS